MKKFYYKSRPWKANDVFKSKFEKSLLELTAGFIGSKEFKHSLTKGEEREETLRKFFIQNLPENYKVAKGEVVDCFGNTSPQLDIMIYDKTKTVELYENDAVIIPAEALLASIEVKSKITKQETKIILQSASKIKKLRPFKAKTIATTRNDTKQKSPARYFHSVFGYSTDISSKPWLEKEFKRIKDTALENSLDYTKIDRIYVFEKGLINPLESKGVELPDEAIKTFMYWYMHLINFIIKENSRRKPIPYELYSGRISKGWKKLE